MKIFRVLQSGKQDEDHYGFCNEIKDIYENSLGKKLEN